MTESFDDDDALRARLRAADPAASLPPAPPERVARLLEETMSSDTVIETRERGTRRRGPLTWMVAAAAALVLGGVGLAAVLDDDADDPVGSAGPGSDQTTDTSVTTLTAPSGVGDVRCQVPRAELIADNPIAFAGTVQQIEGGEVTLAPTEWYAGGPTDRVIVQAPRAALRALLISVRFEEGLRYLVTSSDGDSVMVCGFSAPYSAGLAATYAEAFGG